MRLSYRKDPGKAEFIPLIEEITLDPRVKPVDVLRVLRGLNREAALFQRNEIQGQSFKPVETILAFDPFETIRARGGRALIQNDDGVIEAHGDPFSIVSGRMALYRSEMPHDPDGPGYQGGALGYFAYDSVRHLEPSLCAVEGNLKRNAGEDAYFNFYRQAVVFDHARGRVFLLSGYLSSRKFRNDGFRRSRQDLERLRRLCLSISLPVRMQTGAAGELPVEEFECMMGKEKFLSGVRRLKEHIRNGDIFQAVLSEKFRLPFDGDSLSLFAALSQVSPAPYQFYMECGKKTLIGASPEMLLKLDGRQIETHPIAGTRPRGLTVTDERKMEKQLLRSTKEKAEHLMLVDLARNDIGRVSEPGTVQVSSFMELRKFSGVMHLVSRVNGTLRKESTGIDALAACFPAGTLSGAPKIRAMQLLSGLESSSRGFYGGAVVLAGFAGSLDSCIAIRSIELEGGMATVQAGAGIVADSHPEREYQEVLHKSRMMRKALAFARRKPFEAFESVLEGVV